MQDRRIKIQNIIAMGHKGEYLHAVKRGESLDKPVPRLIEYIRFLAEHTKREHVKALEQESEFGLITRLTLNEFSLYTNDKPLRIRHYKKLITAVADIAKDLPPNIHLILATLPVLWTDGHLHNVALHVQSPKRDGARLILHHLEKKTPFLGDLKYKNKKNKLYPFYDIYDQDPSYEAKHSPNTVLKNTAIAVNDINQYRNVIKIKTPAGESFLVVPEICREHLEGVGATDTARLMLQLETAGKRKPQLASHVISAYSVRVRKNLLSGSLTYADPLFFNSTPETTNYDNPVFGDAITLYRYLPKFIKPLKKQNIDRSSQNLPYDASQNTNSEQGSILKTMSTYCDSIYRFFVSAPVQPRVLINKIKLENNSVGKIEHKGHVFSREV